MAGSILIVMSDAAKRKPAGWVVRVVTQRLGGGEPLTALYAVALPMPSEAEAVIKSRTGATLDEAVNAVDPLSQAEIDDLELGRGEYKRYP